MTPSDWTAAPNNVISAYSDSVKDQRQRPDPHPATSTKKAGLSVWGVENGTQTGILFGIPKSAMCVQRFDDSLIMQVTILIAIRYVLHRCVSQEIHCQKLYDLLQDSSPPSTKRKKINQVFATLRCIRFKVCYNVSAAAPRTKGGGGTPHSQNSIWCRTTSWKYRKHSQGGVVDWKGHFSIRRGVCSSGSHLFPFKLGALDNHQKPEG